MAPRLILLLTGLVMAMPAPAHPVDRWTPEIEAASARFGIPEAWIRAVMTAESGGRTHWRGRPIMSRAGAMGLMQLMPGTWAEMRRRHGLGADPYDPADNILAGTAYLRAMYDRFGYGGMVAAYNAGPARYLEWVRSGRPLPAETRAYVRAVVGADPGEATEAGVRGYARPPAPMMVELQRGSVADGLARPAAPAGAGGDLFAILGPAPTRTGGSANATGH